MLAYCKPSDPRQLLEDFKDTFIVGIRNRSRLQPLLSDATVALQYVLTEIQDTLSTMSRYSISQFGLSALQNNLQPPAPLQQQRTPYQLRKLANKSIQQFSSSQRQVFNKIVSSDLEGVSISNLDQPASRARIHFQRIFFLDAFGGARKNFVTASIQCYLKSKKTRSSSSVI